MKISMHQPNFLPWLGFFDKMRNVDLFVLCDNVAFTRSGYQNRTQLKSQNGPIWLTVPVTSRGKLGQITKDVKLSTDVDWRRKHLRQFESLYGKSKHFGEYFPQLMELYKNDSDSLVQHTIPGIKWLKECFGISTEIVIWDEEQKSSSATKLIVDIMHHYKGTEYLSGPSGKNYLDMDLVDKAGFSVSFQTFKMFEYEQRFENFHWGLSAIDYLFNMGAAPW